jgi:hypothetical protein
MTGTHGYNLRSKNQTNVEHCDQVFESFDEPSMVPSTPRPSLPTPHTGRKHIKADPSESAFESGLRILYAEHRCHFPSDTVQDTAELRAPRHKNTLPPSTPNIPRSRKGMESRGLQGGFTASSDAGGETNRGDIRSRRDIRAGLDDVEAARSRVQRQRDLDAKRIHYQQRSKGLRIESLVMKERSDALARQADELDRWIERKTKEGTLGDDSEPEAEAEPEPEPEPEPTMMLWDNDEAERVSQKSDDYAPTEVFSESEQQAWVLLMQQQGVALQL